MSNDLTVGVDVTFASEMFYLEMRGDGMAPEFPSRSVFLIDTSRRQPTPGGIFALRDMEFDEPFVARAALLGDRICFVRDNPKYIGRIDPTEVQVLGQAVSYGRFI